MKGGIKEMVGIKGKSGRKKGSKNKPKRDEYSEEVKRAEEKELAEKIEANREHETAVEERHNI